jgi:phospholipid/cholesterol/gamma-HCH transport system substrate-binding protein
MKIRKEFIVGIFAAMSITALILGFFFMKGQTLFGEKNEYYAIYESADGISVGNYVKLNGVIVGKVTDVSLNPKDVSSTVIKFEVTNEDVKMPLTTKAEMKGDLLGTVSINLLYPTEPVPTFHVKGDTLISGVAADLQKTLEAKIDPLMGKVNLLLETADGAITTIDNIFGENTGQVNETFVKLNKSMSNFESITKNVDSLTYVLNQNKYQITAMLSNINSITTNLKESNDEITNIIHNFSALSNELDSLDITGVVEKANVAMTNMNLILDEVQNGDGTLTKLMQDPLLYDNMNSMVEEATRLVENIKEHPNRYIQFSVFGGKDKGINLDNRQEKILRKYVKDTLEPRYQLNN